MALPMKRMLSAVSFEMYGGKASLATCIDTPVDLMWRRPGAEALMTVLGWTCWQDRILESNRCIGIGSLRSSCAVLMLWQGSAKRCNLIEAHGTGQLYESMRVTPTQPCGEQTVKVQKP